MPEPQAQTQAQQLIGDFAPKLVSLTDDVLFGDVWKRAELAPRDRSLITVAALIAGGNTEQLRPALERTAAEHKPSTAPSPGAVPEHARVPDARVPCQARMPIIRTGRAIRTTSQPNW